MRSLLAYDADGNVLATLDYVAARGEEGKVIGLVDFAAHEEAGGELTDVWKVEGAAGSKTWPEFLGSRAHEFRVEKAGPPGAKRIVALVHKTSGRRRERDTIEAAIEKRVKAAGDEPADLRDLVGGPGKPLVLDEQGRTRRREPVTRPNLPVIRGKPETPEG